jgi:hypothetical protein
MLVHVMAIWSSLLTFYTFYGHLEYFEAILVYFVAILVYFVAILVYFATFVLRKIWQP